MSQVGTDPHAYSCPFSCPRNYAAGETVEVCAENDPGGDIVTGVDTLRLIASIGGDGKATLRTCLPEKTVDIRETI